MYAHSRYLYTFRNVCALYWRIVYLPTYNACRGFYERLIFARTMHNYSHVYSFHNSDSSHYYDVSVLRQLECIILDFVDAILYVAGVNVFVIIQGEQDIVSLHKN